MALTPAQKLSRFCFTGSLEPVYIFKGHFHEVDIATYLPILEEIYADIDFVSLIRILKESLKQKNASRHVEPLFALAAFYICETAKDGLKANILRVFSNLVETDIQLFLFLKQVKLILAHKDRKSFPKSIEKAVKIWYNKQSNEKLVEMWIRNYSGNSFSHNIVMKLFHIDNRAVGDGQYILYRYYVLRQMSEATEAITKSLTNIKIEQQDDNAKRRKEENTDEKKEDIKETIKEEEQKVEIKEEVKPQPNEKQNQGNSKEKNKLSKKALKKQAKKQAKKQSNKEVETPPVNEKPNTKKGKPSSELKEQKPTTNKKSSALTTKDKNPHVDCNHCKNSTSCVNKSALSTPKKIVKPVSLTSVKPEILMEDLKKLKATSSIQESLKIIRHYNLNHDQVPCRISKWASIAREVLPTMSYMDLLNLYRKFVSYKYFQNAKLNTAFKKRLVDTALLAKSDIAPIQFLIAHDKLGSSNRVIADMVQMTSLKKLANLSCGLDQVKGIKMGIFLNLQEFYKDKKLKNYKQLKYFNAMITLAFGFFKRETEAKVFHWCNASEPILPTPWLKQMDLENAISYTDAVITNSKNSQNLRAPINYALKRRESYDLFLCIGPKFGRSNPNNNSDALRAKLLEYRKKVNPKAKMVLVSLMNHKKSMVYGNNRNEHILEICGLDEDTVPLIDNFATDKFC